MRKNFKVLFALAVITFFSCYTILGQQKVVKIEQKAVYPSRTKEVSKNSMLPVSMDPNFVKKVSTQKTRVLSPKASPESPIGYAWNVYGGSIDLGACTVNLTSGALSSLSSSNVNFIAGADWANDTWYGVQYSGGSTTPLVTIDTVTGDIDTIGGGAVDLTGLAYDVTSSTMYAIDYNAGLYTIDLATGETSLVGTGSASGMISLACDNSGNLFALNLNDDALYSVNKVTGETIFIGSLGFALGYAQDIAYDRDNSILYGALYRNDIGSGGLYTIDIETGAATLIYEFEAELDGFAIPYTENPEIPGAVDSLKVIPAPSGGLSASITWYNPSHKSNKDELTELLMVELYLKGRELPIYKNSSPVIGGYESFNFSVPMAGYYTFIIYGTNTSGNGIRISKKVWIGEDAPSSVENVVLSKVGLNSIELTWEAPSTGIHNEYFSGKNLTYDIIRYPDSVLVSDNQTELSFEETVVKPGIYFYGIIPSNTIGKGNESLSNSVGRGCIFCEDFSADTAFAQWSIVGAGHSNWSITNGTNAGGRTPELEFNWEPEFSNDTSFFVSPIINTEGVTELELDFLHYIDHYEDDSLYMLAVYTTSDSGATWNQVWNIYPLKSIGPQQISVLINNPDVGSDQFQIAFALSGNSYYINQWYIDNIALFEQISGAIISFTAKSDTLELAGAIVTIDNRSLPTDENGNTKFFVESGTYTWTATKAGFTEVSGEITVENSINQHVDIDMLQLFTVSFSIKDAENNTLNNAAITFDGNLADAGVYTFADLLPGTYDYSISLDGFVTVSGEVIVTEDTTLNIVMEYNSLNHETGIDGVNVFPNPFSHSITISNPDLVNHIRISTISGQVVMNITVDEASPISTDNLESGLYIITLTDKEGNTSERKLIKR